MLPHSSRRRHFVLLLLSILLGLTISEHKTGITYTKKSSRFIIHEEQLEAAERKFLSNCSSENNNTLRLPLRCCHNLLDLKSKLLCYFIHYLTTKYPDPTTATMAVTKLIPSPIAKKRVLNDEVVSKMKKALRPRVTFNESRNVAFDNTQWCEEDCKQTWYSMGELQDIKTEAYNLAKLIHKKEKETENLEDTYKNVLLRVYDACCDVAGGEKVVLSNKDKLLLMKILAKSSTRTGLERICIREIAHDRHVRRGEVVDAILGIQEHSSKAASERTCAELSRLSSESVSRASRLFARYMAVALAATIH